MSPSPRLRILPQPTDVSCGPTCLQAVYNYHGDEMPLDKVIKDVRQLKGGGTLAVMLGNHALKRGYKVSIITYNLHVFDPSWFKDPNSISAKLLEQARFKTSRKLQQATKAYLQFLELGGELKYHVLTKGLLRKILKKRIPILTGLSATYLYETPREIGETNTYDDIVGEPSGHFVVLCDIDTKAGTVTVADPLAPNPIDPKTQYYNVDIDRLINAILLGIVTYDANLLIIEYPQE